MFLLKGFLNSIKIDITFPILPNIDMIGNRYSQTLPTEGLWISPMWLGVMNPTNMLR